MTNIRFLGFEFAANKACLICDHVFEDPALIFQIAHDYDGGIQMFCEINDHEIEETKVVALENILIRAPYLKLCPLVPMGSYATKKDKEKWIVSQY